MRTCLALVITAVALCAAEGGVITPAPGSEGPKLAGQSMPPRGIPSSMVMPRPNSAYEIETLVMTPGDPAGLVGWAELAAQGFHLVSTLSQDGKQTLFFERPRLAATGEVRLPSAVAIDPNQAARIQAKLQQIIAERQQAVAAAAASGRASAVVVPGQESK